MRTTFSVNRDFHHCIWLWTFTTASPEIWIRTDKIRVPRLRLRFVRIIHFVFTRSVTRALRAIPFRVRVLLLRPASGELPASLEPVLGAGARDVARVRP